MKSLLNTVLCMALLGLSFQAYAGKPSVDKNIVSLTRRYLRQGTDFLPPLIEALDREGDFDQNVELVLNTILRTQLPDEEKLERLHILHDTVQEYAEKKNNRIARLPRHFMIAGAALGALAAIYYGGDVTGINPYNVVYYALPMFAINGAAGGVAGVSAGALSGYSLRFFWSRSGRIDESTIQMIADDCNSLLTRIQNAPPKVESTTEPEGEIQHSFKF